MEKENLPLCFAEIEGHLRAKHFFERVLVTQRLGHAYLLRGPDGVGKRLFAKAVAARLTCSTSKGLREPCGSCPSCRKYLSNNHPDITVIGPEGGTIKIDRIRALCRSLSYPPYESSMRAVIIEDVHAMRQEAANSLLKTLEEPPEQNVLILTAGASRSVLPTIVSRCQTLFFYGLTLEQTASVLARLRPEMSSSEQQLLARFAEGSPGRALLYADQDLVSMQQEVVSVIQRGGKDVPVLFELFELAERISALKENIVPLLGLIRLWVRDQMLDSEVRQENVRIGQARLVALQKAEQQLERNCNRSLVCEVLLFNLQSPSPGVFL